MSFENALIFPFPAVQYIPLPVKNVATGRLGTVGDVTNTPRIFAGPQMKSWATTFKIPVPEGYSPNTFPVLALNLNITTARYRSFFITMLGFGQPGTYQILTIPSNRIYKEKLFFEVFEKDSGKRLARFSLFADPGIPLS